MLPGKGACAILHPRLKRHQACHGAFLLCRYKEIRMEILVLPGDGIGPEITKATVAVTEAADKKFGLGLNYTYRDVGFASLDKNGITITDEVVDMALKADGVILGPVSHASYPPRAQGGLNPSGELRIKMDLFANIRPSRSRPGLSKFNTDMDLVIVRENTEGFYADRTMHQGYGEFMPTPDLAMAVRKVTREGSLRVARAAFELAMTRPRKKVTVVHKSNVLRMSDGFFMEQVNKVAKEFPEIAVDDVLVDAMAAMLVRDPARYDVIVTTNMFGDILSDEAAEISGSLGLAGSLNAGHTHAYAQAQHGSAPDIAGKGIANPTSLILSAAMLLNWLATKHNKPNFITAAASMTAAVDKMLLSPETRTGDLGGKLGTEAFAKAVIGAL